MLCTFRSFVCDRASVERFRVRVSLGEPAYSKEGGGRGSAGLGRAPPRSTQTLRDKREAADDATDAANGLIAVPGGCCEDKKEIPRKMAVYVDSLLCANSLVQCRIDILLCILALGQKSMP